MKSKSFSRLFSPQSESAGWQRRFVTGGCFVAMTLVIAACDNKPPTPSSELKTKETETAKAKVDSYKANPSDTRKSEADKAIASLEKEIAELKERVATKSDGEADSKLKSLENTRARVKEDYDKGEFESASEKVKTAFKELGKSISDATEKVVDKVRDAVDSDKKD